MKKEFNVIRLLLVLVIVLAVVLIVVCVGKFGGSGKEDKPLEEKTLPVETAEQAPSQPDASDVSVELPQRTKMDTVDLAEYVQQRTVTVNVDLGDYGTSTGSGFFIDDQGTVVTSYHVIDGAQDITVEVSDGGTYNLEKIIDFDPQYDIVIMKIAYQGNPYLEICEEKVRTGEEVYAVGSSLGFLNGTFSDGLISSVARHIGQIECIQTTAAISSGNSGGPLVNAYGEVVGINAFSYVSGENLNLAVHVKMMDELAMDKNWTINKYREWYSYETDRSYLVYDPILDSYYLSMLHTYQLVTGAECLHSVNDYNTWSGVRGYTRYYPIYIYEYDVAQFDKYIEYLTSVGFIFESKKDYKDGTSYYYVEELHNYFVDLYVDKDKLYLKITTE